MPTNLFSANYLVASLLWGALGSGFFLYGWKQKSTLPLAGGILLSGGTYFIDSALYLSVFSLLVLGGMYWAKEPGARLVIDRLFRRTVLGLAAGLLLQAGCASKPVPPRAASPPPNVAAKSVPGETPPEQPVTTPTVQQILSAAVARPPAPFAGGGWQPLFDGRDLAGWRVTDFSGHGLPHCESGVLVIGSGSALSGVTWTNDFPTVNYEVALDAMRVQGSDFFCGLTFPVGDSWCSLILGGWGGSVVGISSIDGEDASENDTTRTIDFDPGRWYRVRVRVTPSKIEAWLDDDQIVKFTTTDRTITLRYGEIEMSKPFGLATWQTTGAMREIKLRKF